MAARRLPTDDEYVLNHCTKYLARTNTDARHDYGQYQPDDPRARICEPWRFPIVDTHWDPAEGERSFALNRVTIVYRADGAAAPGSVAVLASFATLFEAIPLDPVHFAGEATPYFAATFVVPKRSVYSYKLVVDGRVMLDPLNPQQVTMANGQPWSRVFTDECVQLVTFEQWEAALLIRLTEQILPFRTADGERFVDLYYNGADPTVRDKQLARVYRLDENVGVVNYIDKAVAREERHHLQDYRTCLRLVDKVLRARNPFIEPAEMARGMYLALYDEMSADAVPGWDYGRYRSPRYFLQLLRRHCITGAFAHPKYGGNAGAVGWAYLEDRYRGPDGDTLFHWRKALERPLGESADYHG
jgi:hypothetical protein